MSDNERGPARRILVADDEPISRQVLTSMLEKLGYEVEAVNDGIAAWQRLQQPDAPRLVILDWIMPGLEGIEVCRRVRAWRQDDYSYVYMILLTSRSGMQEVVSAYEAGVDDYMVKPFELQDLRFRLRAGERVLDLQEKLHLLATRDELTGLFNRRMMLDVLRSEVARARRTDEPFCLGMLDLDHFKQINDTYGHLAGDAILREAAARMQESVRCYDTLGRWGGEEFLIVMSAADLAAGKVILERVRSSLAAQLVTVAGVDIVVTASLGGTAFKQGDTIDQLIRGADEALYRAKREGRNRVCFYEL